MNLGPVQNQTRQVPGSGAVDSRLSVVSTVESMSRDQYWELRGDALAMLEPAPYESERRLQDLIASFPQLLSNALDDEASQWLTIQREAGIRFNDDGQRTRWSLDNLYADSNGTPVLVEVKRASDPRIRREVVAQLLDYAASFTFDWDAERLSSAWRSTTLADDRDPDTEMTSFLNNPSLYRTRGASGTPPRSSGQGLTFASRRITFASSSLPTRSRRLFAESSNT